MPAGSGSGVPAGGAGMYGAPMQNGRGRAGGTENKYAEPYLLGPNGAHGEAAGN
ncbi:hypothetical protein C1Y40_04523 [Mycobacterium talmoniae]|uniref:Uncharacterized protein n=1 Tax=Mycobacterium talmoniae TaxID=1858794 RepID=A0A2S8BF92_9MYCO|nr:hypothetical protein C1Y40_04523 [Mycobacterium talmoniae]